MHIIPHIDRTQRILFFIQPVFEKRVTGTYFGLDFFFGHQHFDTCNLHPFVSFVFFSTIESFGLAEKDHKTGVTGVLVVEYVLFFGANLHRTSAHEPEQDFLELHEL